MVSAILAARNRTFVLVVTSLFVLFVFPMHNKFLLLLLLLLLYGAGFGSVQVLAHFFTFRFGFGLVLGKTWVLVRFFLAGFGFFPISNIKGKGTCILDRRHGASADTGLEAVKSQVMLGCCAFRQATVA